MSDFLTNFRSAFSDDERASELYKILAMVGVNTEKAILEELNAEIRRSTEASVFTESKLRSWLALFLSPVRNAVSASGFGSVVMDYAGGSSQLYAKLPAGSVVSGSNGKDYQLLNDLSLYLGCSTPFAFVQGREAVYKGVYNDFIAIPIKSGMVDLSYTRVVMGGQVVPQVRPFPSYPEDLSGSLKSLLVDIPAVMGNVAGSQEVWNPVLRNLESLWLAVQAVSIRPRSGFFPFLFNDTLFIKIFSGGYAGESDYVPDPSGQSVTVSYRLSDGAAGNLKQNQLKAFSDAIETEDGHPVSVTIYNNETVNGVNPPSRAELVNVFRRRFYASSHVASLPEYTTWFLSQPEVGDCLVMSDFERWRLSGKQTTQDFTVSGAVDVYLIHQNGLPVRPRASVSSEYDPLVKMLDARLVEDMDVAFVKYEEPLIYWHFFVIQFRAVYSEAAFHESAGKAIRDLYDLKWTRDHNLSLFRPLDSEFISDVIRGEYDVSGFRVVPYHYKEVSYDSGLGRDLLTITHYNGEKAGGWYEFYAEDADSPSGYESCPRAVYREFVEVSGDCIIYRYNTKVTLNDDGTQSWTWGSLVKENTLPLSVGHRLDGEVTFNFGNLPSGVLRCFWVVANESTVSVGNSADSGFGIRRLPSKGTDGGGAMSTIFEEIIRFEKSAEF